MDDETVKKAGTEHARALLSTAEDQMLDLLVTWDEFAKAIKDGELPTEAQFSKARQNMSSLRSSLLKEIQKHEEDVRNADDRFERTPIDFSGLRNEIGRRLARLRAVDETN